MWANLKGKPTILQILFRQTKPKIGDKTVKKKIAKDDQVLYFIMQDDLQYKI